MARFKIRVRNNFYGLMTS